MQSERATRAKECRGKEGKSDKSEKVKSERAEERIPNPGNFPLRNGKRVGEMHFWPCLDPVRLLLLLTLHYKYIFNIYVKSFYTAYKGTVPQKLLNIICCRIRLVSLFFAWQMKMYLLQGLFLHENKKIPQDHRVKNLIFNYIYLCIYLKPYFA